MSKKSTAKLSHQAMSALSMCFLKTMAEEVDIMEIFSNLTFTILDGEIFIDNPPTVVLPQDTVDDTTKDSVEDAVEE